VKKQGATLRVCLKNRKWRAVRDFGCAPFGSSVTLAAAGQLPFFRQTLRNRPKQRKFFNLTSSRSVVECGGASPLFRRNAKNCASENPRRRALSRSHLSSSIVHGSHLHSTTCKHISPQS
jgi:hypothetical protein